jgi:hypothetical protein
MEGGIGIWNIEALSRRSSLHGLFGSLALTSTLLQNIMYSPKNLVPAFFIEGGIDKFDVSIGVIIPMQGIEIERAVDEYPSRKHS